MDTEQTAPIVETKEVVTTTNDLKNNTMTMSEEETKTVARYIGWSKFFAILNYIGGGFTVLIGIPYLLLFGLGLIYIVMGGIQIWLGKILWDSTTGLEAASQATSLQDFKVKVMESISKIAKYWQINGIVFIVTVVLGIVAVIGVFVLFASSLASFSGGFESLLKSEPGMMGKPARNL